MVPESERESNEQSMLIPPFHQRFNMQVNKQEVERRFINRILNMIGQHLDGLKKNRAIEPYKTAMYNVATNLGLEYNPGWTIDDYVGNDIEACLRSLEALYKVLSLVEEGTADVLSKLIQHCLSLSESDLEITWRNGVFRPGGAKLLDEDLVNVNLKWLSDSGFETVLVPFEKGLRHFLESHKQPEKLANTVIDMYEAMEAMAKIAAKRDKDLSANKEKVISVLKLSKHYRNMLGDYIEYANQYRRTVKPGGKRELPKRDEVEAFYYTTGLFIRLSIQKLTPA